MILSVIIPFVSLEKSMNQEDIEPNTATEGKELIYATYFGASGTFNYDTMLDMAFDGDGNIFVVGMSGGASLPGASGTYQTSVAGGNDVYVARFSPDGDTLYALTYFGGSADDYNSDIEVDADGNILICGKTYSTDIPLTGNAYQTSYGGNGDVYLAKFSNDLTTLMYSTYVGGSQGDYGYFMMLPNTTDVFIGGYTWSSNLPMEGNSYDTTYAGGDGDLMLLQLDTVSGDMKYSTYMGQSGRDTIYEGVLYGDSLYLGGYSSSSDFPMIGSSYQSTKANGNDALFIKWNYLTMQPEYSTYYGGNGDDTIKTVSLDLNGKIIFDGETTSTDLPLAGSSFQSSNGGGKDLFLATFLNNGTSLDYATYYGGDGDDSTIKLGFDNTSIMITGNTYSTDLPFVGDSYDSSYNGAMDGFYAFFNASSLALTNASYFGGVDDDFMRSIRTNGNYTYMIAQTEESSLSTTANAVQSSYHSIQDGYFMIWAPEGTSAPVITYEERYPYATYFGSSGTFNYETMLDMAFDSDGNIFVVGMSGGASLPGASGTYQTSVAGGNDAYVAKFSPDGKTLYALTYFGGTADDYNSDIEVDADGNVLICGKTFSTNIPLTGNAYQTSYGGNGDVYLAKFNNDLTTLMYSTYIGGSQGDYGYSILLPNTTDVFIAGYTWSSNLPMEGNSYDTTYAGGDGDLMLLQLDTVSGDMKYSTYMGQSGKDIIYEGTLSGNHLFLGGYTTSSNFPMIGNSYQSTKAAGADSLILVWNYDRMEPVYSSFYGGSGEDLIKCISLDKDANIIIDGETTSTDLPLSGSSYQATNGGNTDLYFAQFSPDLETLDYATYYGGNGDDLTIKMEVNDEVIILTGNTLSSDLPVAGSTYSDAYNASTDGFYAYFDRETKTLSNASYFGGAAPDFVRSIRSNGNYSYMIAQTETSSLLTSETAIQSEYASTQDGFFVVFDQKFNHSMKISAFDQSVPDAPIIVEPASPDDDGTFIIDWDDGTLVDNYTIYRSEAPITELDGLTPITTIDSEYEEIGLAEGSYYYIVVANNASGTSDLSNQVSVLVFYNEPAQDLITNNTVQALSSGVNLLTCNTSDGMNWMNLLYESNGYGSIKLTTQVENPTVTSLSDNLDALMFYSIDTIDISQNGEFHLNLFLQDTGDYSMDKLSVFIWNGVVWNEVDATKNTAELKFILTISSRSTTLMVAYDSNSANNNPNSGLPMIPGYSVWQIALISVIAVGIMKKRIH